MLIQNKSFEEIRNIMLAKWLELVPNANTNSDSMIFIDSTVMAEIMYSFYQDTITLTNNAFLAYATWDELSNLWADRWIPRKRASNSTWNVLFSRETLATSDYIIPLGTIIWTEPSTDGTSVVYETTEEKTLYGIVSDPLVAPSHTINSTWGTIWDWTYNFRFSVLSVDWKETLPSPINAITVSWGGTTKSIQLSWTAIPKAWSYIIYLNGIKLWTSTTPNYLATTSSTWAETQAPVSTNETWNLEISVAVKSITLGTISNSGIWLVTNLIQKPVWIDAVANETAMSWGTDEETDDDYRARIKLFLANNTGKTTVNWYEKTALSVEWVDTAYALHKPWDPINTISVYITSTWTSRVPSPALITEVEELLNSDDNRAVCDEVVVLAPSVTSINITVDIEEYNTSIPEATIEESIINNLQDYINSVEINWIVRLVEIENTIHDTEWVIDFSLTTPSSNTTLSWYSIATLWTVTVNFI